MRSTGTIAALLFVLALVAAPGRGAPGAALPRAAGVAAPADGRARRAEPRHARSAPPPVITSISPDTLVAGETITLTGTGFATDLSGNTVRVANVRAPVISATPTLLTVRLPRTGFSCGAAPLPVAVSVRAGGASASVQHPLRTARLLALQVGEVVAGEQCVELPHVPGEYLVAVVNALPDSVPRSFRLNGDTGAASGEAIVPLARDTGLVHLPTGELTDEEEEVLAVGDSLRAAGDEHMEHLERERERMLRAPGVQSRMQPMQPAQPQPKPVPRVGDVETMRMRRTWESCGSADPVSARVVFVGPHSIILEDVASPLAGRMDPDYDSIGAEFETRMWPVLTTYFGNPTVLDSSLDGDGRVRMLFTPRVKDLNADVLGFVTACDLEWPAGRYASSNLGEVFYATVPETMAGRPYWLRVARGTVLHEVKHIASFAERRARRAVLEHPWMEEATAMVAEEVYARTFSPMTQRGNEMFAKLRCEWADDDPACTSPLTMKLHFDWLYWFLVQPDTTSLLSHGYGAGWSFVRWAADLSGESEAEFFSGLVRDASAEQGGNLARRLGRTFPDMLVDWLVASALDDLRADFRPARVDHSLQGWHTRDIYGSLYGARTSHYILRAYPLKPESVFFGQFRRMVRGLPSATGYFVELGGPQAASQLLSLTDAVGRPLPADTGLRLAIARTR